MTRFTAMSCGSGNSRAYNKLSSRIVRRHLASAVAALAVCATDSAIRADGTFLGGQVSAIQSRDWDGTVADPGLNWNLNVLPTAAQSLDFTISGDGTVNLDATNHTHYGAAFDDWTTDMLSGANGSGLTLNSGAATSQFLVGSSSAATYGLQYFAAGSSIASGVNLTFNSPTNINFDGSDSGAFEISGNLSGVSPIDLERSPSTGTGTLYIGPGTTGNFTSTFAVNANTAVRFLESSNLSGPGASTIAIAAGSCDMLSSFGAQMESHITSVAGAMFAGPDYTVNPSVITYNQSNVIYDLMVDNPTSSGGTNNASITFNADNGYGFQINDLYLNNTGGFNSPSRIITVNAGDIHTGYAGSDLMTGPNELNKTLVTVQCANLKELNAGVNNPLPLIKEGGGVLEIDGDNRLTSSGPKLVEGGALRFGTANSYGTTNLMNAGPADSVQLVADGTGTVPDAMGVAYDTSVPANLQTLGTIPGQSGAFDVDDSAATSISPINLNITDVFNMATALRLGSSSTATTSGTITGYTTSKQQTTTFYLGGGGGSLTISSSLGLAVAPGTIDMGTSGVLLPGLVQLTAAENVLGPTLIHAGTLQIPKNSLFPYATKASVGAYSTTLSTGAAYGGAPSTDPWNGPGQLLLNHTLTYNYGGGPDFGTGGVTLDGGAVGFDGNYTLTAIPGTYGTTLSSSLYQSVDSALAPQTTNILHFGGEYSSGTLKLTFPITDNSSPAGANGIPVALLKSGINSVLDLRGVASNTSTGGTGILGGAVLVNSSAELGRNAVVITDGGSLHVASPGGTATVPFSQTLRVANGPFAGASQINVDNSVTATFDGVATGGGGQLEADANQSVLEKVGGGELQFLPSFLYQADSPGNTWGVKATAGTLTINQLPFATSTAANGFAVFDAGTLHLSHTATDPMIPSSETTSANYGFANIASFAGTSSTLNIDDSAFFRLNGYDAGNWMGSLTINSGPNSVFKVSDNSNGGDTYGTGTMDFESGNVQFTQIAGSTHPLIPLDGAFALHLNDSVLFSGATDTTLNGDLYFNDASLTDIARIDGATVDNTPAPTASTWTIQGDGRTYWNGTVLKDQTQATPGGGGPYTSGTVEFDRCAGALVSIASTGATLDIEHGAVNAGGTLDPFTDNTGGVTNGTHVNVINNSTATNGFQILTGLKTVGTIDGTGTTTIDTIANLTATHIRQGILNIGNGSTVTIADSLAGPGNTTSTSILTDLNNSGTINLKNNDLIIDDISQFTATRSAIINAYNGGAWNQTGISSSSAAVHPNAYGLGYAQVGAGVGSLNIAAFDGQAVASGVSLVKYTLLGDSHLTGSVGLADFNVILANLNTGTLWTQGAFHPGLTTGLGDFNAVLANFNQTAMGSVAGPSVKTASPRAIPNLASDLSLEVNTTSGDVYALASATTALTGYDIYDKSASFLDSGDPNTDLNERLLSQPSSATTGNQTQFRNATNYKLWVTILDNTSTLAEGQNNGKLKQGTASTYDTINIPAGGTIDFGDIYSTATNNKDLTFSFSEADPTNAGNPVTGSTYNGVVTYVGVPEPATLGMLGLGGLAMMRRRRRVT